MDIINKLKNKLFNSETDKINPDYSKDQEFLDTMSKPHKKFCVLPFIHLATTTEGNCRLCCKVSKHDVILDDDGNPFNVNTHSIDEIWNSNHMRDRRLRILNEEKLPECKTCWNEEDIFYDEWHKDRKEELPSKRRKENQKWCQVEKTKLKEPWEDIVLKPRIRYFDVRLSNLCNLKCRMCWPHFSTQISKEQRYFYETGQETWYGNYDVPEWDTKKLWEGIDNNLIHLEEISFVGGEPTLHDEIYELLDKLVETGLSENIRLKFTTNLTNIQERFIEYPDKFKNTIINGSIDGVGPTNDYIRYPSNWNVIETNIKKLLELRRQKYLSLTLTPVVQIYNIFNIFDMVKWYSELWLSLKDKTKKYFILNLDLLYDPSYLSVKVLNIDGKQRWYEEVYAPAINYLDNLIENVESYDEDSRNYWYVLVELRKRVVNIAMYMEVIKFDKGKEEWIYWLHDISIKDTSTPELSDKCMSYTAQLDKHRKQSIYDIMSDFDEIIIK